MDEDVEKIMCHVFIQWLESKNLLMEWMDRTLEWYEGREFDDLSASRSPKRLVDTFPWSVDWIKINNDWETFYDDSFIRVKRMMNEN